MRSVVTQLALLKGRVLHQGVMKGFVPTTLFDHYVDAGNVTTGETDLYSGSILKDVLANDGDKVEAHYGGLIVSGSPRRIRIYFAGSAIFDTGVATFASGSSFAAYLTIIRVSATIVRCMTTLATISTSIAPSNVVELTGLDLTMPNILKITGQGGSTNDIVAKLGYVEYKPKA